MRPPESVPVEPLLKTAPLLVPIFSREDPLEALVSLARLVAGTKTPVHVVSIKEVPHQSPFWLFSGDTETLARFERVSETQPNCSYEEVLTHRPEALLRERAIEPETRWVVMTRPPRAPWWRGGAALTRFIDDPPCNLAVYRPASAPEDSHEPASISPQTILVLASGHPNDLALAELAASVATSSQGTTITVAHLAPMNATREDLLEIHSHHDRLAPAGVSTAFNLVRSPDPLDAVLQLSKRFDLLVLGPSRRDTLRWQRHGFEERVAARSRSAVIQVQASQDLPRLDTRPPGAPPLSALLDFVEVVRDSSLSDKRKLFSRIGQRFEEELGPPSQSFERALWEREVEESTVLSHGVAAPDRTSFAALGRIHVGVWILEDPICFTPDSAPVDVCFVLVGPPSERPVQLVLMERLRQLAALPPLLKLLRSAETLEEATFALRVAEQGLRSC